MLEHFAQANTNNVNKKWALLQTTKDSKVVESETINWKKTNQQPKEKWQENK